MKARAPLRLVDVNANRGLEGLRVCEDIVRFGLQSLPLFRRLRAIRHAIADAVRRLPVSPVELARARGSERDVGRHASGSPVASLERLLLINFQRVKESLRTLEEVSRLFGPGSSGTFQQIRFRVYAAEREVLLHLARVRHH